VAYAVGDTVVDPYDGNGYYCFSAHTSAAITEPTGANGGTVWNLLVGNALPTPAVGGITSRIQTNVPSSTTSATIAAPASNFIRVTFTAVSAAVYKITLYVSPQSTVANDTATIVIYDTTNSVQVAGSYVNTGPSAGKGQISTLTALYSPPAGSTTVEFRQARAAGSGSVSMALGATNPGILLVERVF
jgi:hypothetical protein